MPSSCGSGFAPVAHRSCPEARFAYSRISKKQIVVCCAALGSLVQPQLRHSHASVRRHLRLWSSLPWDAFRKDRKLPRCCNIEIEWTAEACSGKAVAKQWQWLVSPGLHHTTEASAALFGVSQPRPQRSSMISMAPWHHGYTSFELRWPCCPLWVTDPSRLAPQQRKATARFQKCLDIV